MISLDTLNLRIYPYETLKKSYLHDMAAQEQEGTLLSFQKYVQTYFDGLYIQNNYLLQYNKTTKSLKAQQYFDENIQIIEEQKILYLSYVQDEYKISLKQQLSDVQFQYVDGQTYPISVLIDEIFKCISPTNDLNVQEREFNEIFKVETNSPNVKLLQTSVTSSEEKTDDNKEEITQEPTNEEVDRQESVENTEENTVETSNNEKQQDTENNTEN